MKMQERKMEEQKKWWDKEKQMVNGRFKFYYISNSINQTKHSKGNTDCQCGLIKSKSNPAVYCLSEINFKQEDIEMFKGK